MSVAGLITRPVVGSYAEALMRLGKAFEARGIAPLARIDHAGAAARAGLCMAPLTLFVFGDPHAGTSLMQACPTLGIDLPLKLIVWEGPAGTQVGYNDPAWLVHRHGGDTSASVLNTMRALLEAIAKEVAL